LVLKKNKICVYAICKNEEAFVDRWMDAVNEADMVVVTDTGSTDNTVQKLRDRGAVVYVENIDPWRFDTARNSALDHIPDDVDICVSNDLDERFEPGWRQKLEEAWQPCHTRARYMFVWSRDRDGNCLKQSPMEKIHQRHDFRWVHPVHEILQYNGPDKDNTVWVPGLVLNHYPDNSKSRGQYFPLLELSIKENPHDEQIAFWLGREYMYYHMHDKCIQTLRHYLLMPSASWNEERSAAMRFISTCYQEKGDYPNARLWLYKAIGECPTVREPYLQMSGLGYLEKDWPLVMLMVSEALKITNQSGSYLFDSEAWGYTFYDYGAISCYYLGMYEKSFEYAKEACRLLPNDDRLMNNLKLIKAKLD
jgi:glycosyltransferase involved in cell wall biosynthesis